MIADLQGLDEGLDVARLVVVLDRCAHDGWSNDEVVALLRAVAERLKAPAHEHRCSLNNVQEPLAHLHDCHCQCGARWSNISEMWVAERVQTAAPTTDTERLERLAAIRARLNAATPGPWAAQHLTGNHDGSWAVGAGAYIAERYDDNGNRFELPEDEDAPTVSGVFHDQDGVIVDFETVICRQESTAGMNTSDAALIANAPADLRFLLDLLAPLSSSSPETK